MKIIISNFRKKTRDLFSTFPPPNIHDVDRVYM